MNWKEYQEHTAEFFRSLGCEAIVEAKVTGARGEHRIDVWVRFKKFGIETTWVIECKCWNSNVPKEKVAALRSIVEDVGADRGILISAAGFQSGAIRMAEKTNITLTDLEGLKESAREDLVTSVIHHLETKAIDLKYALHELYEVEQTGPRSKRIKARPGVNERAAVQAIGSLSMLDMDSIEFALGGHRIQSSLTNLACARSP